MSYTTLPGFYGQDEEESEMTLGFWFLLQEALWSTDYHFEELDEDVPRPDTDGAPWEMARAVYTELVCGLRKKVMWPDRNLQKAWTKGVLSVCWRISFLFHLPQIKMRSFDGKTFTKLVEVDFLRDSRYRRDVGDTLINASVSINVQPLPSLTQQHQLLYSSQRHARLLRERHKRETSCKTGS
jgi:hypothetical protein